MLAIRALSLAGRLQAFSHEVAPGELVHLVGPNGSGKSTLLALLAGMLAGQGEVAIDQRPLPQWSGSALARVRCYLAQQALRATAMPVWHFLQLHEVNPGAAREATLRHYVQALQLSDKLARPLQQLSGGEWQRVRLAAAFFQVTQPQGRLLLLDEPLTGLDVAQQAAFDALLPPLLAAGVSVIMSGHDLNHTLHHAHRVWLLKGGAVIASGEPAAILTPAQLSALFAVTFRRVEVDNQPWLLRAS